MGVATRGPGRAGLSPQSAPPAGAIWFDIARRFKRPGRRQDDVDAIIGQIRGDGKGIRTLAT